MKFHSETRRYVKFHSITNTYNEGYVKFCVETRSCEKIHSPTKRCVKFTLRRNAASTKKIISKLCPKVRIPCIVYVQATSVLKEYDCWVDCVFLRTSLWKVARFTSEWNKFHILELTHQEIDLSPLRPALSTLSFSVTG